MSASDGSGASRQGELELFVCILNRAELLDDVLAGMLEAGAAGATVYEGRGMWQILASEVPLFTGLRSIFPVAPGPNHTIISVIPRDKIESVIAVIQDIAGDIGTPGAGIIFTLPVSRVAGLARQTP